MGDWSSDVCSSDLIGGEVLAGVPGMFLSIPLMATVRILYRRLDIQGVRLDKADS